MAVGARQSRGGNCEGGRGGGAIASEAEGVGAGVRRVEGSAVFSCGLHPAGEGAAGGEIDKPRSADAAHSRQRHEEIGGRGSEQKLIAGLRIIGSTV